MKANKSPLRFSFDTQRQLLKWDARCWQGRTIVGTSWSGCGCGPAALSLAPGRSCRQGHMPEGELATLLPVPPGACPKPLPFVLILVHHILPKIQNDNPPPHLSYCFLGLINLFDEIVHFFSLFCSLTRWSTSSLLLSPLVFPRDISE